MAGYNASRAAFTPTATQNWVLDAPSAGNYGKVTKFSWGGELGASQVARTRWSRPTTLGTTFTTLNPESGNVQSTSRCRCGTFTGTTPVLAAAPQGLFGISWNKNGGGGIFSMTQSDEEWDVINGLTPGQQICCGQDIDLQGTSMSVTVHWKEN